MSEQIASALFGNLFLDRPVNTNSLILICVARSDRYRYGKDRNIHHYHERELDTRVDFSKVEDGGAGVTSRSGLVDCGEDTHWHVDYVDGWVVEVEGDDENGIDDIHDSEDTKEDPSGTGRKQKGIASSGVLEKEL